MHRRGCVVLKSMTNSWFCLWNWQAMKFKKAGMMEEAEVNSLVCVLLSHIHWMRNNDDSMSAILFSNILNTFEQMKASDWIRLFDSPSFSFFSPALLPAGILFLSSVFIFLEAPRTGPCPRLSFSLAFQFLFHFSLSLFLFPLCLVFFSVTDPLTVVYGACTRCGTFTWRANSSTCTQTKQWHESPNHPCAWILININSPISVGVNIDKY